MFFGRSDQCHQWFYDGFLMLLPSLSMVFDGSGPLVKRCDGFDGSLWSNNRTSKKVEEAQNRKLALVFTIQNLKIDGIMEKGQVSFLLV